MRERHSPERKRPRVEHSHIAQGPSRHSDYNGRYESYPPERRSYSNERERHSVHSASSYGSSRPREEFRKPPPPSPSPRGGGGRGRGRLMSRGGLHRERGGGPRKDHRLSDRSYTIKKRGGIRMEVGDYARRPKPIRIRRRRRVNLSSEEEFSGDDETEVKEEKQEVAKEESAVDDNPVKEEKPEPVEEKPKERKEKQPLARAKKPAINYTCPQCNLKVPTCRAYEIHLQSNTHMFSMRKVAQKQSQILVQMRQAQRNTQNELEMSGEGITEHTVFCPLCKLNYKQERAVHQATPAHKNMKKFLLPNCKLCKLSFKSPMAYEHHLCSVDHLRCKQKQVADGIEIEDNLDDFTTIDSVGEVVEEDAEDDAEERKKKKKKKVSVGVEQIKKIEAYYCDLCRMFLPRGTENEFQEIVAGHCRKRFHTQRYIRYKESQELKKKAEKLQRKKASEKVEVKKEEQTETNEPLTVTTVKQEQGVAENKEGGKELPSKPIGDDDKLWDSVDKDLGELLEETDVRDEDEDEERLNGERFDRFQLFRLN
ncbi:hypothetical protein ABEB36_001247 [Hypothenemus hampei]|uniref:C2H2-type domain-containing protein n=1 Tax=Hypothenemus hampei TaxID=57062 RepID=A0ABD1FEK5_HYPHA